MHDITFVLMSCGETTESECLAAISSFRDKIDFHEVRNVYPQIVALNQMIDLVQTEFFVPLDADIVLESHAWNWLNNALNRHRHRNDWHSILFPLWDTLTERRILALKLMRTEIMKKCPFIESATPDVEHYQRLTNAGFSCVHDYLHQRTIGKHVVKGARFCYHKYRDLYQTYKSHQREWDSGAFVGGKDLSGRALAHFHFFLNKWLKTNDDDYLWCIAGMADGLMSPAEHRSKDLTPKELKIQKDQALDCFLEWYRENGREFQAGHYIF